MIDINLQQVTKDYGNNTGVFEFDFTIKKGEIFGLVGTNGSGKTTTIRQIMGFLTPSRGKITVRGMDALQEATKIKHFVGYIPGEINFPDLPTGNSFIKSQAELLKLADFTNITELINTLQIDLSANPRKMSKGMKQKTAIIAALMNDADIYLLDEPSTGLDPLMQQAFLDLLKKEKAKGKTILISSHNFQELEALCDRIALIKMGRIIDIVSLEDIRNPQQREFKIEFINKTDFDKFKTLPYEFGRIKEEQNQMIIKVNIEHINNFLKDLAKFTVKFISENKLNLEKYCREKFRGSNDD